MLSITICEKLCSVSRSSSINTTGASASEISTLWVQFTSLIHRVGGRASDDAGPSVDAPRAPTRWMCVRDSPADESEGPTIVARDHQRNGKKKREKRVCTRVSTPSWSCLSVVGSSHLPWCPRSTLKKDHDKTPMDRDRSCTYAVYTSPSRLPRSLEETLDRRHDRASEREAGVHPRKFTVVGLLAR